MTSQHLQIGHQLFRLMAEVFEEECEPLSNEYVDGLLRRRDIWVLCAAIGEELVGGITAYTLPLTRMQSSEVFIYDIAVRTDRQRLGVGRALVTALRQMASNEGISELFVPADEEDVHALDFYRAMGGVESPVRFFSFSDNPKQSLNGRIFGAV